MSIQLGGLDGANTTPGAVLFRAVGREIAALGTLERLQLLRELEAGDYAAASNRTRQIFELCARAAGERWAHLKGLK